MTRDPSKSRITAVLIAWAALVLVFAAVAC